MLETYAKQVKSFLRNYILKQLHYSALSLSLVDKELPEYFQGTQVQLSMLRTLLQVLLFDLKSCGHAKLSDLISRVLLFFI